MVGLTSWGSPATFQLGGRGAGPRIGRCYATKRRDLCPSFGNTESGYGLRRDMALRGKKQGLAEGVAAKRPTVDSTSEDLG